MPEEGREILPPEGGEKVLLLLEGKTPLGTLEQGGEVDQRPCQLVGGGLVLVGHDQIRRIRGVEHAEHLMENVLVASLVLLGHGDAIRIAAVELTDNRGQRLLAATGMVVPEDDLLPRRVYARPGVAGCGADSGG